MFLIPSRALAAAVFYVAVLLGACYLFGLCVNLLILEEFTLAILTGFVASIIAHAAGTGGRALIEQVRADILAAQLERELTRRWINVEQAPQFLVPPRVHATERSATEPEPEGPLFPATAAERAVDRALDIGGRVSAVVIAVLATATGAAQALKALGVI
jgi:hypothetical protein